VSAWLEHAEEAADAGATVDVVPVEDGIVEIRMRDAVGHNGMSAAWVLAFIHCLRTVTADTACKVVLLTGIGEYFCTGATLEALGDLQANRLAPTELTLGRQILGLNVPVIGVAEGHAIGGGLALLLSCDLALINEESRYGANFMTLGITPGMGMTHLLEDTFGKALAHELLYTGDLKRGMYFKDKGGFNAILPRGDLRRHALHLARALAEKPRDNLIQLKRVLTLPRRRAFEEASTLESLMHELSLSHLDLSQWGAP